MPREIHPFPAFVPSHTHYLLLGSFVAQIKSPAYDWYYSNGRNHFWPILEQVYYTDLKTKAEKQALFVQLNLAITDIILSCNRAAANNLDTSLVNLVFNKQAINKIFREHQIQAIYFTSRFVEKLFKQQFTHLIRKYPTMRLITLPSPSPRYAVITKSEKIKHYQELLPKLNP